MLIWDEGLLPEYNNLPFLLVGPEQVLVSNLSSRGGKNTGTNDTSDHPVGSINVRLVNPGNLHLPLFQSSVFSRRSWNDEAGKILQVAKSRPEPPWFWNPPEDDVRLDYI